MRIFLCYNIAAMKYLSLLCFFAWVAVCAVAIGPFKLNAATQQNQAEANTGDKKSEPSPASALERRKANEDQAHPNKITTQAEPKSIRITELPPNDTWYKTYVIATIIMAVVTISLAIIGFFGVRAANRTLEAAISQLGAIQRQADTMERQEKILADSVAVAERSANAALTAAQVAAKEIQIAMERERPRISVEVSDLRLKESGMRGVSYTVDCWCPTPAFIVKASIYLGLDLGENEKPTSFFGIPIDKQVRESARFEFQVEFMQPLTKEIRDEIASQERTVWLWGFITYRGVQLSTKDPPYRTSFRWRWIAADMSEDPDFGVDFSSWTRDGKPEDNQQT